MEILDKKLYNNWFYFEEHAYEIIEMSDFVTKRDDINIEFNECHVALSANGGLTGLSLISFRKEK